MLKYENDNRRKGSVCSPPWSSVKKREKSRDTCQQTVCQPRQTQGSITWRNSIFPLLWYHECLPCRLNYLLGDFILFHTVRLRHNLSDRREVRWPTLRSVLGAVVTSAAIRSIRLWSFGGTNIWFHSIKWLYVIANVLKLKVCSKPSYLHQYLFYKSDLNRKNHLGNGKAIQLQAWTGREGSRRFRLPDFKTIGTWRW
jgi:hypothetical protein